jgi:thiol-disulfide isomerase/thioredoxin
MKDPKAPFTFWGITPQGDTLRNTDARFTGKVLLVDIMGTWCHNCLDAAPVLEELYERYGDRGLEVVGLAFEISDDPMLARKNLSLYQKRHGISFPLLFCGSLDAANVQQRIRSQLEGFGAYPTTLFVGRDGRVRSIHMGFTGPGTGELYQSQITAYFREVERLIADRN